MKTHFFPRLVILLPAAFLLLSCGNNAARQTPEEKVLTVASEVSSNTVTSCFMRTEGKNSQDTAAVRLVTNNEIVMGKMVNMPFEKDWREGTVKGRKNGDTIVGIWTFMQEGMWDSIKVSFLLKDDQLIQKETAFNPESGREVLPDTSHYSLIFKKIDCTLFPSR
jgi:hypothetical protein